MTNRINKLLLASLIKLVPADANPDMVRKVELARDKAWHDAFLNSGGIV